MMPPDAQREGFDSDQMRTDLARIRRRLERLSRSADEALERFRLGREAAGVPPAPPLDRDGRPPAPPA